MALIYLIRHGKAAGSFTDDMDPGLDEIGRSQAIEAATSLQQHLPLTLLSSPLKRAQETATPLASALEQSVGIEKRVAEIPSPGLSLTERGPWLQTVMSGRWSEQSDDLKAWQQTLCQCLVEIEEDTVIFSHFVAINAAVSWATGSNDVLVFRPDNGSITIFDNTGDKLTLIKRGNEATTRIN
jgi:broad specificity phosphatase PhoE